MNGFYNPSQPFINKRKLCVIALSSRDRGSVIGMTGDWHPHDSMNEGIWEGQEIN